MVGDGHAAQAIRRLKRIASMWVFLSWLVGMAQRYAPLASAVARRKRHRFPEAPDGSRMVRRPVVPSLAPCPLPLPPLLT